MSRVESDRESVDRQHMARCGELADEARSAGNTPVGSLVALGSKVISEASEAVPAGPDPFAHAELLVVREAMERADGSGLDDATLYTTHEPCFLCSYAIREADIRRVVIKTPTPGIGGATSRYPILIATDVPRWRHSPKVVWLNDESDGGHA